MAHRTPAFHRVYFPALRNWPSMAQVYFCQHGPPGPPQLFTPHSSVPEPQLGLSPRGQEPPAVRPHSVGAGAFILGVTGGTGPLLLPGDQVPVGTSAGCEGRPGQAGRVCRPRHVSCPAHPQPWTLRW